MHHHQEVLLLLAQLFHHKKPILLQKLHRLLHSIFLPLLPLVRP